MAETSIQNWLEAANVENQEEVENNILTDLCGSLDLGTLTFATFTGDFTSRVEQEPDLVLAGRVLSLLPRVLNGMQVEASRHEVSELIPYLCARLEDASPGVMHVARSLEILSTWKKFPPGDAQQVARATFKLGASNNFSSQTASTRIALYELIDSLAKSHATTLKRDMTAKEFIQGVVDMAALEKNALCLRALFKLYAALGQRWALEKKELELLFDSYIRYFPVSIKNSTTDSSLPSKDELANLLLECFISSDGYASMTFDAMFDRLDVDSADTKVEVFRTLDCAIKSYSVPVVAFFASKLWDTLKFEVWNGSNEEWIESSLNLLRSTAASLDRTPCDWSEIKNPLYKFVAVALKECKDRIVDRPVMYIPTCGRIFSAIASSCPYGFYLVTKFAIPILDTRHQDATEVSDRIIALEALNGILQARLEQTDVKPLFEENHVEKSLELQEYELNSGCHMTNGFETFKERIVEIYHGDVLKVKQDVQSLSDLSFAVPAIKGMVLIFGVPDFLSISTKTLIVADLVDIALNINHNEQVRDAAISALGTLSGSDALLFEDVILPIILGKLPATLSQEKDQKEIDKTSVVSLLDTLVRIGANASSSLQQSSFVAMQVKLIHKLVGTISHPGQLEYQHAILASFNVWFATVSDNKKNTSGVATQQQSSGSSFDAISVLLRNIVEVKLNESGTYVEVIDSVDDTFIQLVGEYIMKVIRTESLSGSNFLVGWDQSLPNTPSGIWTLFTDVSGRSFASGQVDLAEATRGRCYAVALSMYIVAGLRREDMKLIGNKSDVAAVSKAMLLNCVDTNMNHTNFTKSSVHYFLQLLVNKFGAAKLEIGSDGLTLERMIHQIVDEAATKDTARVRNIYQTLIYFAAASLNALDPSAEPLIKTMVAGISNPTCGRKVAQGFRLLLGPSKILTKDNFCLIRPLRKGRAHGLAVDTLIGIWRATQEPVKKQNALIAVVGIIAYLEPEMLANSAQNILPVLLEGTNIQEDNLGKEACIKGLLNIIPLAVPDVEQHLNSIIARMTDRIRNTNDSPSDSNAECRCMALEVLSKLVDHVNQNLLLKKKSALIRELDSALEDVSPAVRHKAERCKMAWFNIVSSE